MRAVTTTSRLLASGAGWQVRDVVCEAGPGDRAYEERHETVCIAVVTAGTFQYRSSQGAAVMAPGSILLGNADACFECGHEHARGDRCLALHVQPEWMESLLAEIPDARRLDFARPNLPPSPQLAALWAEAESARDDGDAEALEELALRLAGAVAALLSGTSPGSHPLRRRDERRVTAALRRIEAEAHTRLSLEGLARDAAMSRYHFLRTFRQVVGTTPHQHVLGLRLHRAAIRLRRTRDPVSTVALDAGFEDLSTFNRRFRRVMGATPSTFRTRHRVRKEADSESRPTRSAP